MTSRNQARRHKGRNRMVPRTPKPPSDDVDLGVIVADPVRQALDYWAEHDTDSLFVYFIQGTSGGPVKIGKARNPQQRLRELQCGNPDLLVIRAVLLSTEDAEEKLHLMWQSVRVRGEWFGGGMEDAIVCLAKKASAWQIERHKAGAHTYAVARTGAGMVAHPGLYGAAA